jgi:TolB-like protein/tetratricopeptide (TPR) repeat protein/predicted Ser/Thr protein kinase
MIGETISHYTILGKLGEGGMGVVYKAEDTKLGRTVALKFLPHRLTTNESEKARFLQEAKSASALNHPNICTIYYLEEVGEQSFIVMEYIDGSTLRDRLPIQKIQDAVDYAIQVAEALHEAHTKGIVHRDIKSDNIMVNSRNQAKVMDFGLAKLKGSLKLTRTSSTVGTLAYMAPEQVRGEEVDSRSDIFSFGVVLFEMLTGAIPFRGEHEAAIMYSVLNEEPDTVEKYRQDVPQALAAVIARALEKDPADRYQHADDLVSELRRIRKQSTKVVRPSMEMQRPAAAGRSGESAAFGVSGERVGGTSSIHPASSATRDIPGGATQPGGRARSKGLIGLVAGVLIVAVLAAAGYFIFGNKTEETPSASADRKMLVVIPFENLGSPDQEYFADGITEEITGKLSGVSGLGVIARTSAMQYKKTTKSMKEIGSELGVGYVLQGTIRWGSAEGGAQRVRVSPALIKVSDGTQIWSQSYDAVMSDVFKMQSDIASQAASAMGVALLQPEQASVNAVATTNSEAYDYYLRGTEYRHRSYQEPDMEIAIKMFSKAIELDPDFGLAYARLAEMHFGYYWFFYDHTEARLETGKKAVDRVLQIDPNLPEAHFALGYYYYWGRLDYENALREFNIFAKARPSAAEVHLAIGAVYRRQGKMREAATSMMKACEMDPRSTEDAFNTAQTFALLRDYDESEKWSKRAISLSPELSPNWDFLITTYMLRDGTTLRARQAMNDAASVYSAETDDVLRWRYVQVEMMDEQYPKALDLAKGIKKPAVDNQFLFKPRQQVMAELYALMGDAANARRYFDSARTIIEGKIQERPDDARYYSALGIVDAGLGLKDEAIKNGKRGIDLLPVSKEAWRGTNRVEEMAVIYSMTHEYDLAAEQLERLLSIPSLASSQFLRADPRFKPLRSNPRFAKLVAAQ